ncbi:MAG: hypothetical protein H0U59_00600 [Gemmatimonadaceae bacterium]|nr:hypothetical protein [Gemmatimonadaceae bacterium]
MARFKITAPDVEYVFDGYSARGAFGPRHIAVNVKYHGYPKLEQKHVEMLEHMRDVPACSEDKIREEAWTDVAEGWWEDARSLASALNIGSIHSAGRQGGWLVLADHPLGPIEEMSYELEDRCAHCDNYDQDYDHTNGQCLFMSTYYTPTPKLRRDNREHLDGIVKFIEQIELSLSTVEAALKSQIEQSIEAKLSDFNDGFYEEDDDGDPDAQAVA